MSSLALMRWLEGTPERYDAGMRLITLGRVAALHDSVAREATIASEPRVLEIGCGSGSVTALLVARGARVTAFDQDPAMLEQARRRLRRSPAPAQGEVTWVERTASEIDTLAPGSFDAAVLSLCLSEMSRDERRHVLEEARIRLAPGGRLIAADEVRARGVLGWSQSLLRAPQAALAWLLAGSVSTPLSDLRGEIEATGLKLVREQHWLAGTLALFVAECRG